MLRRLYRPARELRLSGRWSAPLSIVLWVHVLFSLLQLAAALIAAAVAGFILWELVA